MLLGTDQAFPRKRRARDGAVARDLVTYPTSHLHRIEGARHPHPQRCRGQALGVALPARGQRASISDWAAKRGRGEGIPGPCVFRQRW